MAGLYCMFVMVEIFEKVVLLKLQEQNVFNELSDAVSVVFPSKKVCDSNIVKLHSHNTSCGLFQSQGLFHSFVA